MPYQLDETNEPLSGETPVQAQAKAASPEVERKASGLLDIGQTVRIVSIYDNAASQLVWIGQTGTITGHEALTGDRDDIYMVKGEGPVMAGITAPFYRNELEPVVQPINFTEAIAAFIRSPETVDAFLQAAQTSPEALPGIIDVAVDVASGTTRYVSLMTSTCKVCGYEETLEMPQETDLEDMLAAVQYTLVTPCPECEAALQAQTARADLEMYDQGLETLEDE